MLTKIRSKNGNKCLLECGHIVTSRGKYRAKCNTCNELGLRICYTRGGNYLFKTTTTSHEKCMNRLASKCRWEHMGRLAVLTQYSDIICNKCKEDMCLEKVEYGKKEIQKEHSSN